jgi:hypothetical protein
METIIKRMKRPTPLFFKRVRNGGFVTAGTGIAILLAPFCLSAVVLHTGGYLLLTGVVGAIISQTGVKYERK